MRINLDGTSGGGHGRRLYCRLTSFSRSLQTILRINLDGTEVEKLAQLQKMWALRKPILDAHILSLQEKVLELEQEIDGIVMEKILRDF